MIYVLFHFYFLVFSFLCFLFVCKKKKVKLLFYLFFYVKNMGHCPTRQRPYSISFTFRFDPTHSLLNPIPNKPN